MNKSKLLKWSIALNIFLLVFCAGYGYYKRGTIMNIVSTKLGGA